MIQPQDWAMIPAQPFDPCGAPGITTKAESESMDITQLLRAAQDGESEAADQLYGVIYSQLRQVALRHRSGWRGDETLNTTALVNEAWLKLADGATPQWESRGHFLAVAATVMRQILVDKARHRSSLKRGANVPHQVLDEGATTDPSFSPELAAEILCVHEALEKLARIQPRQARVIECRFFGGYQVDETSQALGISLSTVRRDWELAKLWLQRELDATT